MILSSFAAIFDNERNEVVALQAYMYENGFPRYSVIEGKGRVDLDYDPASALWGQAAVQNKETIGPLESLVALIAQNSRSYP